MFDYFLKYRLHQLIRLNLMNLKYLMFDYFLKRLRHHLNQLSPLILKYLLLH